MIRLHGLASSTLNFDEGATAYFSRLPLAVLWGPRAVLETNPPLFYTAEHLIIGLVGGGAATFRFLSALCGALSVPISAFIARKFAGQRSGIAAACLVATSSTCIAASQDGRTYAMLGLSALVACAAEVWLLHGELDQYPPTLNRLWAWFAYVGGAVSAIYLHNTAVLMVVAFNAVAASSLVNSQHRHRQFLSCWLGANLIVLISYLAWIGVVAYQFEHTLAHFWIAVPTLSDLRFAVLNTYAQPDVTGPQPLLDAIFVVVFVAGIWFSHKSRVAIGIIVFLIAGIPLASWLISQYRPIMNGKTLLWLTPFFLVFVAIGCTHFGRLSTAITVMLLSIQLVADVAYSSNRWDEGYSDAGWALQVAARKGDVLYLDPPSQVILLQLYGLPSERLRIYAPPGPDAWFVNSIITPLPTTKIWELEPAHRVWILTRGEAAEHQKLTATLGTKLPVIFDQKFGRGLIHNRARFSLELSLSAATTQLSPPQ